MNDPPAHAANPPKMTALPQAKVLSYVATVTTPTRVRVVAARAVLVWGIVNVAVGVGMAVMLGVMIQWEVERRAGRFVAGMFIGRRPPLTSRISEYLEAATRVLGNHPIFFLAMSSLLAGGMLYLGVFRGVRRGQKVSTGLAGAVLGPQILALLAGTALVLSAAALEGIGLGFGGSARPLMLLWLLATPVAVLGILILHDVAEFLGWIRRNPMTERPGVRFIDMGGRP
jgi:hypothetical protein